MPTFKKYLESIYMMPVLMGIAVLCFALSLTYISIGVLVLYFVYMLMFGSDLTNIFSEVLFVPYIIKDIYESANWVYYGICIGLAVVSLVIYVIRNMIMNKNAVKGKMFIPLIVFDTACLLGGLIGHFNILAFLAVIGFSIAGYIFYYIALNNTVNLKRGILMTFVFGAITITLILILSNVVFHKNVGLFHNRGSDNLGAINVNEGSIFVYIGMLSAVFLGIGKKFDYLYFLSAVFFFAVTVVLACRTVIGISALSIIACFVLMVIYSPKKSALWISLIIILLSALAVFLLFREKVTAAVLSFIKKITTYKLTGRDKIWKQCLDWFIESPIFGHGFIWDGFNAKESLFVLVFAHNTFLQWLSCLGVVGVIMVGYFYYKKYKTLFTKPSISTAFFIMAVIGIELSGLLDSAATLSIFVNIATLLLLAGVEKETLNSTESDTITTESIDAKKEKGKTEKTVKTTQRTGEKNG